jgi:hypothetical protein
MRDIKQMTSLWINENKFVKGKFAWQEGYAAFSYGQSQLLNIIKYIENQEEHHRKHIFRAKYLGLLRMSMIKNCALATKNIAKAQNRLFLYDNAARPVPLAR